MRFCRGFLSPRGTPSHHPAIRFGFSLTKTIQRAGGTPMTSWNPPWNLRPAAGRRPPHPGWVLSKRPPRQSPENSRNAPSSNGHRHTIPKSRAESAVLWLKTPSRQHVYSHPQIDGKVNPYSFNGDLLFHLLSLY